MKRLTILPLLLLLPACGRPPGATPVHGGGPRTPQEELVRKTILEAAPYPETVEFLTWGPNLDTAQAKASDNPNIRELDGVVRVVFRCKTRLGIAEVRDVVYSIRGDSARGHANPYGDDWRKW